MVFLPFRFPPLLKPIELVSLGLRFLQGISSTSISDHVDVQPAFCAAKFLFKRASHWELPDFNLRPNLPYENSVDS